MNARRAASEPSSRRGAALFAITGRSQIEIDIEIRDGRARAREVCVSSDRPLGVGSVTMKSVPALDLMARGIRHYLHQIDFDETGSPIRVRVQDDDPQVPAIVKKLVGYVEVAQ